MAKKLRFYGGKMVTNTRTITNQIGPDVMGVATKRTLPTFTDSNTVYVSKTGNDSNAGTNAAPKLTIGAATLAASNAGRPYVVIKDNGVYEESASGNSRSIYAAANMHPTIKFPASQATTEAYLPDTGIITAYDYYHEGNFEYSLRGVSDAYFTGTINDYQIIDGVHWIASTKGIWYSFIGYTGWYLVSGTAGSNFKHLVSSDGSLFVVKTGTGIYRVSKSGISLEVSDSNVLSLAGNDDHLAAVTNVSGRMNVRHMTTQGWVLTDVSVKSNLYYTAITGFNKMFQVGSDYYLFVHVKDSDALYYGGSYIQIPALTETSTAPSKVWVNTWSSWGYGTTNVATVYDVIQDTNKKLLYVASTTVEGATLHSFDYSIITSPNYRHVTTPATFTRLWADLAETGQYYLGCSGGLYRTSDWTTFSVVVTTTGQTPVTIFDSDPGRIILGNTWTADCSPPLYLWRKYVIHHVQQINGVIIDGNNLANVGLFVSYANGEHEVSWNCEIKNCTVAGVLDGGLSDQRTKLYNSTIHDCGIGVKVPDFATILLRLYRCYIHDNQYGITGIGYSKIYGPEVYNSVVINNTVRGIWYEGLSATATNPLFVVVKWSIIWGNGFDLVVKNKLTPTLTNSVANSVIGTYDVDSRIGTTNIKQIDPLLLSNGDYKDTYGGYAYDSIAYTIGADMFTHTRSRVTSYTKDHFLTYLPVNEAINWKVSNFSSTENAYGEYSESFDGFSRTFNLTWNQDSMSTRTELFKIIDLWKDEDGVFMFGASDGTNWIDQQNLTPTVGECDNDTTMTTITNHPTVGLNEFAGWYLEVFNDDTGELIYIRILSHNASDGTTPVTYVLDRVSFPGDLFIVAGTNAKVVSIPVKIDKSAGFNSSMYGYVNTPLTGYSLSLREVRYV